MGFKRTNLLKSELQIRINIPSIGKALNFFLDLQSNQITIVVFIEAITVTLFKRSSTVAISSFLIVSWVVQDAPLSTMFSVIWYYMSQWTLFGWHFLMNKGANTVMDDGWVHSLAKTLPSLISNLWWTIVMDDWNLDENPLSKSIIPQIFSKEILIMLG